MCGDEAQQRQQKQAVHDASQEDPETGRDDAAVSSGRALHPLSVQVWCGSKNTRPAGCTCKWRRRSAQERHPLATGHPRATHQPYPPRPRRRRRPPFRRLRRPHWTSGPAPSTQATTPTAAQTPGDPRSVQTTQQSRAASAASVVRPCRCLFRLQLRLHRWCGRLSLPLSANVAVSRSKAALLAFSNNASHFAVWFLLSTP